MFTHFLKSSDQLVFGKCLHICKSLQTNLCLGSGPPLTLSLPLPFDVLDEVFTFCLWHVSHGTVSLFKFWLHVHPQEKQSWRSWQSWRVCRKIWWVYPMSYQGPDWRKWISKAEEVENPGGPVVKSDEYILWAIRDQTEGNECFWLASSLCETLLLKNCVSSTNSLAGKGVIKRAKKWKGLNPGFVR